MRDPWEIFVSASRRIDIGYELLSSHAVES